MGISHGAIHEFGNLGFAFVPASDVSEKEAVRPIALRILEQRNERVAIEFYVGLNLPASNLRQCGEDINMSDQRVTFPRTLESGRPSPKGRNTCPSLIRRGLLAAHARIENFYPGGAAVIGHEDHQ